MTMDNSSSLPNELSGCGESFRWPDGCSGPDCQYIAHFQPTDEHRTQLTVGRKAGPDAEFWSGIAVAGPGQSVMKQGEAVLFIVRMGLIIDIGVYRMRGYNTPPEPSRGRLRQSWTRTVGEWHMASFDMYTRRGSPEMAFLVGLNPLGNNGTIGYHQITAIEAPFSRFRGANATRACLGLPAATLPENLPVRLVDENGRVVPKGPIMRGKLEAIVLYNGEWGSVCDDMFDAPDAQVVCNMLGLGDGMNTKSSCYPYRLGSYQFHTRDGWNGTRTRDAIHMDNLNCRGEEESLLDCPPYVHGNSRLGDHDCWNIEDVGLTCSVNGAPHGVERPTTISPYPNTNHGTGAVRLVDEQDRTMRERGRLQIQIDGVWGSVCDDGFDQAEISVVCRQLGFPFGTTYQVRVYRTVPSEPIWLDDLGCTGREESLLDCLHLMDGGIARPAHSALGANNCGKDEDVHLQCSINDVPPYPSLFNSSLDMEEGNGALRLVDERGRRLDHILLLDFDTPTLHTRA